MFENRIKLTSQQKAILWFVVLFVLYWSGVAWHVGTSRHKNGTESAFEILFFDFGYDSTRVDR